LRSAVEGTPEFDTLLGSLVKRGGSDLDTEMAGLDNQDLSGIAGGVALMLGQF
jgi:hypothetical protein